MEFWKNDFKFSSRLYFKFLIIILEYSDAIKKQKEEETKKVEENLRKRQISDKMQELKEKKLKIHLEKQKELGGIEEEINELIKTWWIYI